MIGQVLVDAGPLVAFVSHRDEHHDWVREETGRLDPPFLTCEPVISESCFLLQHIHRGVPTLMDFLVRGLVQVPFRLEAEIQTVKALMDRYANVPMSLADACLVRMSELDSSSVLLTLDRHFKIYRRNGRQVIPTIMPD